MFDVGFMELLLVGVVALMVVGPERLPGLARSLGAWTGRLRTFVTSVKADIENEIKAEELKKILEVQQLANPLETIIEETKEGLGQVQKDVEGLESPISTSSKKND